MDFWNQRRENSLVHQNNKYQFLNVYIISKWYIINAYLGFDDFSDFIKKNLHKDIEDFDG